MHLLYFANVDKDVWFFMNKTHIFSVFFFGEGVGASIP